MTDLQKELFQLQDIAYKEFQRKLIPNVEPEKVIGIRTPALRKFAKQFSKSEAAAAFLEDLPHFYYEENNLHMMLLIEMRDFSTCSFVSPRSRSVPILESNSSIAIRNASFMLSPPCSLLPAAAAFSTKWGK